MAETPGSSTPTLWQEHHVRGRVAIAQAESCFGQVYQSLDTPRVVNEVTSHDSDCWPGRRRRSTFRNTSLCRATETQPQESSTSTLESTGKTSRSQISGIGGEGNGVRHSMMYPPLFCLMVYDFQIYVSTYGSKGCCDLLRSFFLLLGQMQPQSSPPSPSSFSAAHPNRFSQRDC